MATTLRFNITGDDQGSASFARFAAAVEGANGAVDRNSAALKTQSRTAQVAAGATIALAESDKILAAAERELAVSEGKLTRAQAEQAAATDEARKQLEKEGRAAEVAAVKLRLAGNAAADAGGSAATGGAGFTALQTPMAGAIAAGVALAPVLVTTTVGLGGLAVAGYATVAPIVAAAQATGGLAANMSTLSPVQQQMARELLALEGTASTFAKSLQPQVVKLWSDGMTIAGTVLHDVQPVAKATGDALHGVLGSLNASLATGQWHDFFAWMATTAGPNAKLLGTTLVDLLNTLPQLVINLQPVATQMLQATDGALKLVGGVEKLDSATVHLGDSSQHSAGWLGIVGNSAKNAATEMLPGLKALPLLKTGLDHVSSSAAPAAGAITNVTTVVAAAAPAVGTLSGDLAILASTTSQSTLALQAYSDLWNIFVGNAVSDQQAVLNVTQAFESYNKTAANSKKTSTQVQQAFLSIFTTIGTGLDTLHKNGASVSQLNSFYATNIARLNALHGLTPAQKADVQGLTRDYLAWASSVTGLSGNVVKAAGSIRGDFLSAVGAVHRLVPSAKDDANAFASAILKTGTNSSATAGDRKKLIADLVHSGLSAQSAGDLVKGFQGQINSLRGKTVNVGLTTSGKGQIIITGTGINTRSINTSTGQLRAVGGHTVASGWYVSGGTPGKDSVPLLAMPGELVVPTHMVAAGEADHMRGRIPGFAAGGVVGKVTGAEGGVGLAQAQWGQLAAQAFAASAVQASMKSAAAAAAASAASGFTAGPAATGSALAAQNFARAHLADYRWGQDQFPPLLSLWNKESGWNAYAVNPGSGAYGIPQCVPVRTRILTRRGWLAHDEVRVGDETIGYNPATGVSEWTPVTAVHHPGIMETWRFGDARWSAECTPGHRWLTEKESRLRGGPREVEFVRLADKRTRHRVILAQPAGDGAGLPVSVGEAALLGWIAGDGWEHKGKPRDPMTYYVCQVKAENFGAIEAAMSPDPRWRVHRTKANGCREWRLSAPYARDLTARAGNPKTDCVAQVLGMSAEQRAAWLGAVIGAEGHVAPNGSVQVSQCEGPLADAIVLAVYLSGRTASIYKDERYERTCLTIGITRDRLGRADHPGSFTEGAGHAEVWCVTTGLGSWTAEQDGQVFLTGNSLGHGHPYNLGDFANQVRWGLAYIFGRYGSPAGAWAHERAMNWYGNGLDAVFTRPTVIGVGERGRERVQVTPAGRGGGGNTYNITVNVPPGAHPAQAGKEVIRVIREYENVNGAGWRSG